MHKSMNFLLFSIVFLLYMHISTSSFCNVLSYFIWAFLAFVFLPFALFLLNTNNIWPFYELFLGKNLYIDMQKLGPDITFRAEFFISL